MFPMIREIVHLILQDNFTPTELLPLSLVCKLFYRVIKEGFHYIWEEVAHKYNYRRREITVSSYWTQNRTVNKNENSKITPYEEYLTG